MMNSIVQPVALPRFLGLDIGNRRIGVAVSDELGLTAQPVLTLERRRSRREDLRSLARLCRRFGVVGIVVGNPVHLSGETSPQAANNYRTATAGSRTKLLDCGFATMRPFLASSARRLPPQGSPQ